MPDLTPGVSVVVPVFQGEQTLDLLLDRLKTVLGQRSQKYEVVLVDDGSKDKSWQQLEVAANQDGHLTAIRLARNVGQHNALLAGVRSARYDTVVTIDDDLQNPPEEIERLLEKLDDGFDVVYGVPAQRTRGFWRAIATWITKFSMAQVTGNRQAIHDLSAFRAFRTELRDAFEDYTGPFVSVDVLLAWGTTRFSAVTVRQDPRVAGKSNYSFLKLISHAMNMMTGFGTRPLQLASLVGFTFTLFGVAAFVYVFVKYLVYGSPVPGFPFLASIVAIFSGAQLFAIGIMGEYLARMHFRLMGQPPYVIAEKVVGKEA